MPITGEPTAETPSLGLDLHLTKDQPPPIIIEMRERLKNADWPDERKRQLMLLPPFQPLRSQAADDRVTLMSQFAQKEDPNFVVFAIGSTAKGTATHDSDAEIAIYNLDRPMDQFEGRIPDERLSVTRGILAKFVYACKEAGHFFVDDRLHIAHELDMQKVGVSPLTSYFVETWQFASTPTDKLVGAFLYPVAGNYPQLIKRILSHFSWEQVQSVLQKLTTQYILTNKDKKRLPKLITQVTEGSLPWKSVAEMEADLELLQQNPPTFREIVYLYGLGNYFWEGSWYSQFNISDIPGLSKKIAHLSEKELFDYARQTWQQLKTAYNKLNRLHDDPSDRDVWLRAIQELEEWRADLIKSGLENVPNMRQFVESLYIVGLEDKEDHHEIYIHFESLTLGRNYKDWVHQTVSSEINDQVIQQWPQLKTLAHKIWQKRVANLKKK